MSNHTNLTTAAVFPDPGKLNYRTHNIYLNFLESYGRIPPGKPITIHQKALFTFWMSTVLIWTLLQLWKVLTFFSQKDDREYDKLSDLEENIAQEKNGINDIVKTACSSSKTFVEHAVDSKDLSKRDSTGKNCVITQNNDSENSYQSKHFISPCKDISSKRNDYLDQDAFNAITKMQVLDKPADKQNNPSEAAKIIALDKMGCKLDSKKESKVPLSELVKKYICDVFLSSDTDQPTFERFLLRMMLFGCFMFYFFLTDYLHIWPKVAKQYSRDMFVFLFFLLVIVAVVFSIRKTKDKFLNRDQTEEWKGWMQVQFVWYHYFDAQETYNSIRCYVGAYVWMTGFGNYIYFSTRKDYSIFRLLKMLFRLNFLVFCVMAVTDHEFVRYYICAMHTYWFLSVWAVMVVFNRFNDNQLFLLLKFVIYAVINAMIFNIPGASERVFMPFKWALHDNKGTLRYWKYRAWLDHWSTLVGIIFAFNYDRFDRFLKFLDKDDEKTKKQRETLRYGVTAVLLVVFAIWFHYVLLLQKEPYLSVHPFTSPVPIVLYAILRNLHPILRSYNLNLFTWLGKITLETYISQIHLYMIGDAKAILVYLPQYPMLNFMLATLIYMTVSYILFHLTVFFSSYIFPRNIKVVTKNIIYGTVWLGICYFVAHILTTEHIWKSDKSGLEFLIWKVKKY